MKVAIANTSTTSSQLDQRLKVVNATLAAQQQSLEGLKLLETSLRAQVEAMPAPSSTSTLSERLNGLGISLEVQQALSNNLGKQIDVLEMMKAGLTTTNVDLDALITALKADNDGLPPASSGAFSICPLRLGVRRLFAVSTGFFECHQRGRRRRPLPWKGELRAAGHYVVAPGSQHPNGGRYEALGAWRPIHLQAIGTRRPRLSSSL